MIVRSLRDAEDSPRRVVTDNWESTRLLLSGDGLGFSLHVTTIYPGTVTPMCYRNHLEAVYCLEGVGELEDLADASIHRIAPGVVYALDRHDEHILRAHTRMRMVCVFSPALNGREVHDASGSYPLGGEVLPAAREE
ncbi:MAG: ectoine synthase [Vicinamibacterales bacterium]|nr:ectoine synthase [Acidobacteriota bacterium]